MLHSRQSRPRALSYQSVSDSDPTKRLRQVSMQSINNFSLRRLLGSDPSGNASSPRSLPEASKSVFHLTSKEYEGYQPAAEDSPGKAASQSHKRSLESQKDQAPGDSSLPSSNQVKTDSPIPTFNVEFSSCAEDPSTTVSPPTASTGIFHRLLFNKTLHPHSQNLGSKAPAVLRHNPLKENQSPRAALEAEKIPRRPASSPAPPGASPPPIPASVPGQAPPMPTNFKSLKLVIPDRHSSLSPPPLNPSPSPGSFDSKPMFLPLNPLSPTSTTHSSIITSIHTKPLSPILVSPRKKHSFQANHPFLTVTLPTPTPPLTLGHYECYQEHRHMYFSPNIYNPVPCMACGAEEGRSRWKCYWCCLRVCEACMDSLGRMDDRNLTILMDRLEKSRAGVGRVEGPEEILRRGWRVHFANSGAEEDFVARAELEEKHVTFESILNE